MSKVLLFNPPGPSGKGFTREGRCTQEVGVWATQWPPVSLATAAAFLEKDGHTIKVIDFPAVGLGVNDLIQIVKSFKPDIGIWNTGTPTLEFDINLAKLIKDISPEIWACVIGTHVSVEADKVLRSSCVDIVIRNEPEITVRNICKSSYENWKDIPGISYKDSKSYVFHNNDANFIKPEDIPNPSWHYLDINAYRLPLKGRPFLIVAPVRGCPFMCNFCTSQIYYGRKLRKRPVSQVIKEIENNINRYKVNDFFIWADTFTADKEYVKELCNTVIARNLKITWTCNSRVDTIDKELLLLMKKAGLWMISFGLESGNDEILRYSGKKITVEQSKSAVNMAHELDIRTSGHFIFGLPGETKKTMNQTLSLSLQLPIDIAQFYTASPFPGTDLYNEAKEKGWINTDTIYSQSNAIMRLPDLSPDDVNNFRKHAYKKFYFRKDIILNLIRMIEPEAVKNIIRNIKGFLKWIIN